MSTGDDDGEDAEWQSVVEDFETRLDDVEDDIDAAESAEALDELESRLDAIESALDDSDVPADSDEYDDLQARIETVRDAVPPAWMVDVWALEDDIAAVEGDIEDAGNQADLDDLHERLDDLETEIADSSIPADADERADLESRVAEVREQVPADWHATVWRLEGELEDVEAELEDAELEAELDEVEAEIDEIETEIDGIDWGDDEADDADEGEEDEDDEPDEPEEIAALRDTVADLRGTVEDKRGPYAEDVQEEIESAEGTLTETDWTPAGQDDAVIAVEEFLDLAGSEFVDTFEAASDEPADLAAALADVRGIVGETELDPDDDRETIQTLLEGAETLTETLDGSEAWTDLTVQQELERRGFYDVLTPKNRKDYPPEWTSVKLFEQQYKDPEGDQEEAMEMILLAMEKLTSDFMEENILDSLERIAPPEAFDELEALAQKRNQQPIRILGRIGDERALETIHDYVDGGDTALRKVTLRAIGMIGSEDSTQIVADQLVDEDDEVRSTAARALGLIGDTRAIDPLADVLESDETDEVRASAAWALNQIGTERAREAAAAHADDTAYIVQVEAEKAQSATEPAA